MVLFTDLDGTLLDRETYRWDLAQPAIDRLVDGQIPWIFTTSKTRAEVEYLRQEIGNKHPFIVENGGAAFIPEGYFPFDIPQATWRDGYHVIEWGAPYTSLVAALMEASDKSGCPVRGFHAMTPEQISHTCGLPLDQAERASRREYDEPFEVLDYRRKEALCSAIDRTGLRWTRGDRFWHIYGNSDKGAAVDAVTALYRRVRSGVVTAGLGDGWNDVGFLRKVDHPFLVRSADTEELHIEVPQARLTREAGPSGWNEAVQALLESANVAG